MKMKQGYSSRLLVIFALAIGTTVAADALAQESAADVYGRDVYWNATPNDINNLLKGMKDQVEADYQMDIRTLDEVDSNPENNPILYRSGHYNFSYTPAEREKLRKYLLGGGMIVYNTGLGSAPFYRSVVHELGLIFPEQPLQRLTSDHPIFHSYYDVDRVEFTPAVHKAGYKGNEPWFDAVEINCRVVALVSRWGMAVGWQGEVKDEYQAYRPQSAVRLGINIFAYASAMRAWVKNAAQAMKFVDAGDTTADKVSIVQVVYDGVWKTRHAGISVLLQTFNRKTRVPVKFTLSEKRLTDPGIFDAPLMYITGHEAFELSANEKAGLKRYLDNGGFLFAEACCGRKGFDLSFRKLMASLFPADPLMRMNPTSQIFKYPNEVTSVGVTPTLMQDLGKSSMQPILEGIVTDGHCAVIYSRFGMAGGWEMSQSPYARGYNEIGSLKMGQNILMYCITQ
jgi:hypothetical protein